MVEEKLIKAKLRYNTQASQSIEQSEKKNQETRESNVKRQNTTSQASNQALEILRQVRRNSISNAKNIAILNYPLRTCNRTQSPAEVMLQSKSRGKLADTFKIYEKQRKKRRCILLKKDAIHKKKNSTAQMELDIKLRIYDFIVKEAFNKNPKSISLEQTPQGINYNCIQNITINQPLNISEDTSVFDKSPPICEKKGNLNIEKISQKVELKKSQINKLLRVKAELESSEKEKSSQSVRKKPMSGSRKQSIVKQSLEVNIENICEETVITSEEKQSSEELNHEKPSIMNINETPLEQVQKSIDFLKEQQQPEQKPPNDLEELLEKQCQKQPQKHGVLQKNSDSDKDQKEAPEKICFATDLQQFQEQTNFERYQPRQISFAQNIEEKPAILRKYKKTVVKPSIIEKFIENNIAPFKIEYKNFTDQKKTNVFAEIMAEKEGFEEMEEKRQFLNKDTEEGVKKKRMKSLFLSQISKYMHILKERKLQEHIQMKYWSYVQGFIYANEQLHKQKVVKNFQYKKDESIITGRVEEILNYIHLFYHHRNKREEMKKIPFLVHMAPLIKIRDIDLKKCEDEKRKEKILKNKEFILKDQRTLEAVNLTEYFEEKDSLFVPKLDMWIKEDLMLFKLRRTQNVSNISKQEKKSINPAVYKALGGNILAKILEMSKQYKDDFDRYAEKVDKVWSLKNNKPAYIQMTNHMILNKCTKNISMFDIMTLTSLCHVYNEIDWKQIHLDSTTLNLKQDAMLKTQSESNQSKINQALNKKFKQVQFFMNIPQKCVKKLLSTFNNKVRNSQPLVNYKISIMNRKLLKDLNKKEFGDRFHSLVDLNQIMQEYQQKEKYQQQADDKLNAMKLPKTFRQSVAFAMTSANEKYNIFKLLFQLDSVSIYQKLFDPTFDFHLKQQIHGLVALVIRSQNKSIKFKETKTIELQKRLVRRRSSVTESSLTHKMLNFIQFKDDLENRKQFQNSDRKFEREICPYQRQGALDYYNSYFCRYLVIQKLEKKMEIVKDSNNLMYKRVETLIDDDDQDYNYLAKTFGYKCRFIRNPKRIQFLFEIFVPIHKKKGQLKILMKKNNLKKRNDFSNGKKQNDFIMKALEVEDILTDDSMKGIDYRDINPDFGAEEIMQEGQDEECKHGKKRKKSIFLGVGQTQLQYYQDLAKKQKEQQQQQAELIVLSEESSSESECLSHRSIDSFRKKIELRKSKIRPKVFQILSLQELEEIDEADSVSKAVKNKQIIEKTIKQLQNNVIDDNISHLKNLNKDIVYTKLFTKGKDFMEQPLENDLKIRISNFNDFLKKINIPEKMNMPAVNRENEKINLFKQMTNQSYQKNIEEIEDTQKFVRQIVIKEKFKFINKSESISIESFEYPNTSDEENIFSQVANQKLQLNNKKKSDCLHQPRKSAHVRLLEKTQKVIEQNYKFDNDLKNDFENYSVSSHLSPRSNLELENELNILKQLNKQTKLQQQQKAEKLEKFKKIFDQLQGSGQQKKQKEIRKRIVKAKRLEDDVAKKIKFQLTQQSLMKTKSDGNPWGFFQPMSIPSDEENEIELAKFGCDSGNYEKSKYDDELDEAQINDYQGKSAQFKEELRKKTIDACKMQKLGLLSDILNRYPMVNEQILDSEGNSLVILATITGNQKVIELLLNKGFDADVQNEDGNTALHYAIDAKMLKIVELLINFGANEHLVNNQGKNPWELLR